MAPNIRALALGAIAIIGDLRHGVSVASQVQRKVRKCSNPDCNNENSSNAPYCSGACCRAARASRALSPLVFLLLLCLPLAASAEVLIVSTASDKPGILPTSPELRAALDRWREGFESRPSCAKCGLVCECGECRCEAAKVKPTYTAAPANVECRNGRCYRVQPAAKSRPVYVPQPERRGFLRGMFGR